jgi:acyl-CoA thioesterase-1
MKIQKALLLAAVCVGLGLAPTFGQTRILPLGDSVTSSFAPYSSYRYWLWQRLVNAGYDVNFVGTQYGVTGGTPENTDFDQNHEGHPGWNTQDGVGNIDSIAAATVPDVVLLDLGGNDVLDELAPEVSTTNIVIMIERLRAVNPNVVVLLAQPTPFVDQNKQAMSRLRNAVKRAARIEKQAGARVAIVNLAGSFNARTDTSDGTHPNERGEQKIANRYFSALRKVL